MSQTARGHESSNPDWDQGDKNCSRAKDAGGENRHFFHAARIVEGNQSLFDARKPGRRAGYTDPQGVVAKPNRPETRDNQKKNANVENEPGHNEDNQGDDGCPFQSRGIDVA